MKPKAIIHLAYSDPIRVRETPDQIALAIGPQNRLVQLHRVTDHGTDKRVYVQSSGIIRIEDA
jgi:hypothetical protein